MDSVKKYFEIYGNDESLDSKDFGKLLDAKLKEINELEKEPIIKRILEWYPNDQFIKADGLDDAIIGVDENDLRLIYSQSKVMKILIDRDGMDVEEAHEYFMYNIHQAYVGEGTPIWCMDEY